MTVEEQTVATEAGQLAVDGGRSAAEVPGGLAVGHGATGLGRQLGEDFGALEPIGGREGLTTEGSAAVEAEKPLDTVRGNLPPIESDLLVAPARRYRDVIATVRIRAERRPP
jgi:hypothetical protein